MSKAIMPGGTLGILGSGQLGRMLALAAKAMGYYVHCFSPDKNSPAGQVCDFEVIASYKDRDALQQFARNVDVVTLEFENIPIEALEAIETIVPVRPGKNSLYIAQNRLREKTFLAENHFPVVPFARITSEMELTEALTTIGYPAVLKTAGFGYDGKGQTVIQTQSDIPVAFAAVGSPDCILEAFIPFRMELSIIAARGNDGKMEAFRPFENQHRNHILDITLSPARITSEIEGEAIKITQSLMQALDITGLLCVEFFLTEDNRLLINEIAPRPHNSGHLTIDAAVASQFEQQIRAVCGLPLGSPRLLGSAAMANLLGDLWQNGDPDWIAALAHPDVKLHLYGKHEARPGRKMGHLTATGNSLEEVLQNVTQARKSLLSGNAARIAPLS